MEACLGVRHTNSMQFVTVEKLQKSPKSRNCRNHQSRETAEIVRNALTSAHACAEVNKAAHVPVQVFMWLPLSCAHRIFIIETWKGVSGYQKLESQWNVYLRFFLTTGIRLWTIRIMAVSIIKLHSLWPPFIPSSLTPVKFVT